MKKNFLTILAALSLLFAVSCGSSEQESAEGEKEWKMQVEDVLEQKSATEATEIVLDDSVASDSVNLADTVSQE